MSFKYGVSIDDSFSKFAPDWFVGRSIRHLPLRQRHPARPLAGAYAAISLFIKPARRYIRMFAGSVRRSGTAVDRDRNVQRDRWRSHETQVTPFRTTDSVLRGIFPPIHFEHSFLRRRTPHVRSRPWYTTGAYRLLNETLHSASITDFLGRLASIFCQR